MKLWPWFVLLTVLCWGAYVPTIHHGQAALGKNSALRAFLFIGVAYFVLAVFVLGYLYATKSEPLTFTSQGVGISTFAGVLGAIGALGIVFALKHDGRPILVAPLVFAGAPLVNTVVSMLWSRPEKSPNTMFYVGILLAGAGAALVLRYRPT